MNMFFSTLINENTLTLIDQEAQHCSRVLRKKVGELINVMDGNGNSYEARISAIGRNEVITDIIHRQQHKPPSYPTIAFGLIKNTTRLEWLLEKITEIGVTSIIPLITARSERKNLKVERLQKVIVSAAKQSLKYHLPILHEAIPYQKFIQSITDQKADTTLYVANYNPDNKDLWNFTKNQSPSVILIGPEGDFTIEEVGLAKSAGAIGVNLGSSRLRAETAAMVACAHLNALK
ncbi:MAG: 16S rRNA (uracil1498-N3)-methyltransferase [Saprospiraceae bacterium]|jgi:16S rRNA (uracil1498-N3)-methyltransferase